MIVVTLAVHFWPQPASPMPQYIRDQVKFTLIYPSGYTISPTSWQYLSQDQAVEFTVHKDGRDVVFTEEATPLAYQDDAAAYNRFIGNLRPRANFNVPLGTVSIANFVTAGDYQVVGESGILNTHGTLLVAHPQAKQPTDDEWRALFESLKVD